MEQITINETIKDIKINQLQEEIKRLKEIIAWQSKNIAGLNPPKLILKKETTDMNRD